MTVVRMGDGVGRNVTLKSCAAMPSKEGVLSESKKGSDLGGSLGIIANSGKEQASPVCRRKSREKKEGDLGDRVDVRD